MLYSVKVAGHPLIKYEWIVEASNTKEARLLVKGTNAPSINGVALKVEEQNGQRTNNASYKKSR